MPNVDALYRYPVKGLSAEPLPAVSLAAGETFPFDRAYAIENGPCGFDPAAPRHLRKAHFLMLMRNERLAALQTRYEPATTTLVIRRDGAVVAEGRLDTPAGRATIEAFFDQYSADELRGPTKVLSAPGFSFSDAPEKFISLINLASLRELAAEVGAPVHPLRFRGNVYIDGLAARAEFDWVGKRLSAGSVRLEAVARIDRCAATNVNPETARRDMAIPRTLVDAYGRPDCGIYLKVVSAGEIRVGDAVAPDG